jgi:hypothetical protein
MALRIVKPTGDQATLYQRGIELAEAGIIVRRFVVRYFPEVDERIKESTGQTAIRVQSRFFSRQISIEGEVKGPNTSGILAFTLGTGLGFVNDVTVFKDRNDNGQPMPPHGTIVLDDATEIQDRQGWRAISVRASSNPLL